MQSVLGVLSMGAASHLLSSLLATSYHLCNNIGEPPCIKLLITTSEVAWSNEDLTVVLDETSVPSKRIPRIERKQQSENVFVVASDIPDLTGQLLLVNVSHSW
jgi:2-phospho-L-lactate guanylyltransferase (CobY/MobA/RfbA family)